MQARVIGGPGCVRMQNLQSTWNVRTGICCSGPGNSKYPSVIASHLITNKTHWGRHLK